jgi:hypothetical protein
MEVSDEEDSLGAGLDRGIPSFSLLCRGTRSDADATSDGHIHTATYGNGHG